MTLCVYLDLHHIHIEVLTKFNTCGRSQFFRGGTAATRLDLYHFSFIALYRAAFNALYVLLSIHMTNKGDVQTFKSQYSCRRIISCVAIVDISLESESGS